MSAPAPSVVIVDDHQLFRAGVRAELDGLVEVLGDAANVEDAVRCIVELAPDVVLLDVQMPGGGAAPAPAVDPELDQLTAREREVLQHIARGYLYKEIALRLGISAKTVEAHVSAVLRKLQLSNRHELSRWAVERRLVD